MNKQGNEIMNKIYKLENEGREIHLPSGNQTVAIVWDLTEREIDATKEYIRSSYPYIDFVSIRGKEGGYYEDEDSPVAGGINPELARTISLELECACQYLEEYCNQKERT